MVQISVSYEGELHCSSTHGPSGSILPTDAPVDNLGRGAAFSPTDLTATSLGACMLTTMAIVAKKQSLAYDLVGATAAVTKHMTAEPPRRISRLEVVLTLPSTGDEEIQATLEKAAHNCPVALSLHPSVEQAVTFNWAAA